MPPQPHAYSPDPLDGLPDDAVVIQRVTPTGLGFAVTADIPEQLAGRVLEVWSSDAGSGAVQRIGWLRSPAGATSASGHIRHAFAPAGLLTLRSPGNAAALGMTTRRTPGLRIPQQLLRPVEIPLDGGAALLVRRPNPISALLARLRQGA